MRRDLAPIAAPERRTAAAFDAAAEGYDAAWTESLPGVLQRQQVWRELERIFRAGDRVLDLGCGTGVDAAHLARMGLRIHALDPSPAMLARAARRIQSEGLDDRVTCDLRGLADLDQLRPDGSFAGAISNFGALNCVRDLDPVARELARLIRPGGRVVLCFMGRFCLWETLWYLARASPAKAFRRRGSTHASLGAGPPFPVYYHAVASVTASFRFAFRLVSLRGIGVLAPPSYVSGLTEKLPQPFRLLGSVDERVGHWPVVRALGDHRLIVLEKL